MVKKYLINENEQSKSLKWEDHFLHYYYLFGFLDFDPFLPLDLDLDLELDLDLDLDLDFYLPDFFFFVERPYLFLFVGFFFVFFYLEVEDYFFFISDYYYRAIYF